MNARARIRKAIKWGGAVVCVVMAVVWVISGWCDVRWHWPRGRTVVRIGDGSLGLDFGFYFSNAAALNSKGYREALNQGPFLTASWTYPRGHWRMLPLIEKSLWSGGSAGGVLVDVPLWIAALLTLIPTTIAWRLDARARRVAILGRCTKCGYDLAGLNADAPCPECGQARGLSA